jgi:anti-sigma factor RsiW
MTTMPHPTEEALARFRRGELPPPEIALVGPHLADCRECAAAVSRSIDVSRAAASLRDDFADHLRGDEVVAYVDGSVSTEDAARAAVHLADCEACRADVADLRAFSLRRPGTPPRSWRRFAALAAAAVLAIVILAAIVLRREPAAPRPAPPQVDRQRAERDALVTAALRDGLAKPAMLVAMAQPGQAMRGVASGEEPRVIEPVAVVIEDTRPLFRWSGTGDASVSLSIFSEGRTVVRVTLHGNEWKSAQELDRGKTYRWQIEVATSKKVMIAPGPSDPPALFAVLSENAHRALGTARARFPNDDLYLGVLAARDGLQDDAVDHLRRYCASHPGETQAAALLRDVEEWRPAK